MARLRRMMTEKQALSALWLMQECSKPEAEELLGCLSKPEKEVLIPERLYPLVEKMWLMQLKSPSQLVH